MPGQARYIPVAQDDLNIRLRPPVLDAGLCAAQRDLAGYAIALLAVELRRGGE